MKTFKYLLPLLFFNTSFSFASDIQVDRLSDKIIVLTENYFRSVAIKTEKGIVLIDTRIPFEKMEEVKTLVKNEFNTDSFCYIINTHGCPEHILGNPAFPGVPVIMNEGFFKRQITYTEQRDQIDSLHRCCENLALSEEDKNKACDQYEKRKNWKKYCEMALAIKPDITFSEEFKLYFNNLTIHIVFTGLVHGYSTFIYIPEEQFLHTSTLNDKITPPKFAIPKYLDNPDFLSYQMSVLQKFMVISDSLKYIVPCHNDYISNNNFKQLLNYYLVMYNNVNNAYNSHETMDAFTSLDFFENKFPASPLFNELSEKEFENHKKNVELLWNYFETLEEKKIAVNK